MAHVKLRIADMSGLWRVRAGKTLRWPERIMPQPVHPMNARGEEGYVVDLDQPYEKALLFGAERLLEPVPAAETERARERLQVPASFPRPVVNYLAEHGLAARVPLKRGVKPQAAAMAARAAEVRPPSSVPGLDEPPKGRPVRKRKEDEDAVQDDAGPAGS